MRKVSGRVVACASVALLAACSNGGGGGVDPVSLSTKADVVREIGNVAAMQGGDDSDFQPAPHARARSSRAQRMVSASASSRGWGGHAKGYVPASEQTVSCDSGSLTFESFEGTARNYPLFGVTPPSTDYSVNQYRDCVDNSYYPWVSTSDGRIETGDSASTAQTPAYSYELLGSGGTPYADVSEDKSTGDRLTAHLLGRVEYMDTGAALQSLEVMNAKLKFAFGGDAFSMTVGAGEDGNPLVVTDNYSAGTLAVDGPIRYSSSYCEGGRVEFTTIEPMTFGSDEFGSFINGGQLVLEAGDHNVTVTFQSDGGATYQFDDGASGAIARDEMSGGSECLF